MNIHQMQIRYQPGPDRVLWQLRTTAGELYAVWLTRRMLARLTPPLQNLVTQGGLAQVAPNATVLPEAREMLAQAARERPLPNARFNEPFDAKAVSQPLGPEPLLPDQIDLARGAEGRGLQMQLRESGGRQLTLRLTDDLATAMMRLIEQALVQADWGLVAPPTAPPGPDTPPAAPTILN